MTANSTRIFLTAVICTTAISLTACQMVTTRKSGTMLMSETEFKKYVEGVFRYHNRVMNDLIEASGDRTDLDPVKAEALSVAEEKMIDTCRPLNELVAESLSGKEVGLAIEMNLADTVPACEEASEAVEELIP